MTKHRICVLAAVGAVAGVDATERVDKARQRRAAGACKAALARRAPDRSAPVSVSHSRGWAIVAVAEARAASRAMRVGADLEYIDPARDWRGIMRAISPDIRRDMSDVDAARVWTAYEAIFKACGAFPDAAGVARLARLAPEGRSAPFAGAPGLRENVVIRSDRLPQDPRFAVTIAVSGVDAAAEIEIEWIASPETGDH